MGGHPPQTPLHHRPARREVQLVPATARLRLGPSPVPPPPQRGRAALLPGFLLREGFSSGSSWGFFLSGAAVRGGQTPRWAQPGGLHSAPGAETTVPTGAGFAPRGAWLGGRGRSDVSRDKNWAASPAPRSLLGRFSLKITEISESQNSGCCGAGGFGTAQCQGWGHATSPWDAAGTHWRPPPVPWTHGNMFPQTRHRPKLFPGQRKPPRHGGATWHLQPPSTTRRWHNPQSHLGAAGGVRGPAPSQCPATG